MCFGKTTMCDVDQQTKKKNGLKQRESSLGMHVSLITSLVATTLPTPLIGTMSAMVFTTISTPDETPTVMTTSFISQKIDLGIHDIMCKLSRLLAEIVKPMVQNERQQSKEFEVRNA